MSTKEWLLLWILFIAYLFLGATIFYYIERNLEEAKRQSDSERQRLLIIELERHYQPVTVRTERSISVLAKQITQYCTKEFSKALNESNLYLKETSEEPYKWTYYNAFFFALTTLSTIGYGNLTPTSSEGMMILIFYALIGVPFTTIMVVSLGDLFGSRFLRAHHQYKNHVYESKLTLVLDVLIYLIPGIVFFIFAPTFIFMAAENWTFYQAVYYAFITLSTIGFGDYVAGQTAGMETPTDILYKIFILFWIMFGLGYLVMIFGFISKALKSKRLAAIEQSLASRFKNTQSKIWHEFIEDVALMRRALNEAYINKVKPVYREKQMLWTTTGLSRSMPNLSEWPEPITREEFEEWRDAQGAGDKKRIRRRAMSEGVEGLNQGMPRVMSEGALVNIDVETTFKDRPRPSLAQQDLQTDEFLNTIVTQRRLSVFDPSLHEGGYNLYSDDEILQSEQYETRQSFDSLRYLPKRSRAQSDAFFTTIPPQAEGYDHQFTWSGSDSLRAQAMLKNMRAKKDVEATDWGKTDKPSPAANIRRLSAAAINFFSGDKKKKDEKKRLKTSSLSENPDQKRASGPDEDEEFPFNQDFLVGGRRPSLLDVLGPLPPSGTSTPLSPMLEQTSLADFIRVMSTLRSLETSTGSLVQATAPPGMAPRDRRTSLGAVFAGSLTPREPPLPREVLRAREASSTGNLARARRYSQAPVPQHSQAFRRRAASISQGTGSWAERRRMSGRWTPPARAAQAPPSVVVTSPDGQHRFRVDAVARSEQPTPGRLRGSSLSEL